MHTTKIDIADCEGASTDGFIDRVRLWLNEKAIARELSDYHDMTADITDAWDVPVKPEWFSWSHPILTRDYSVTVELHHADRVGDRLIAHYMVEVQ
jgi:hypothetical protein